MCYTPGMEWEGWFFTSELVWVIGGAAAALLLWMLRKGALLCALAVSWYIVLSILPDLYVLVGNSRMLQLVGVWVVWGGISWGLHHVFQNVCRSSSLLPMMGAGICFGIMLAYWAAKGILVLPPSLFHSPKFLFLPTSEGWSILWALGGVGSVLLLRFVR